MPQETVPSDRSASNPTPAAKLSALAQLERDPNWRQANAEQRAVMRRIAAQRDQRTLERLLREQDRVQRLAVQQVDPHAPLHEKLSTFARLHPAVTASVLTGLALMVGPGRLLRVGRTLLPTLLPLLTKLRR